MKDEKQLKEKDYLNYINNHIANIRIANIKYGKDLSKALNISERELNILIAKHDESKYYEEEFEPYRQYFYPCSYETKNEESFNEAWKHHYTINKHHPEYWLDEFNNPRDMEPLYIAEMLLDWESMSMKFGGTAYDYYMKNRENKHLSENSKRIIDSIINIFNE